MEEVLNRLAQFTFTDVNYFDLLDTQDGVVASNSLLRKINPNEGGSPKRLLMELEKRRKTEQDKATTIYLERGSLIHEYLRSPEEFQVLEVDAPSGKLGEVIKYLLNTYSPKSLEDIQVNQILESCQAVSYGAANWKDDTKLKKFEEAVPYLEEKFKTQGKIGIDKVTATILENAKQSIYKSEEFHQAIYAPGVREYPLLVPAKNGLPPIKVLLDNLLINEEEKRIRYIDYKTTSDPLSTFMGSYHWAENEKREPTKLFFMGAFQKYRIYRQLGLYMYVIHEVLGEDLMGYNFDAKVGVIETVEPYEVKLLPVTDAWLYLGRGEAMRLLQDFRFVTSEHTWA